MTRLTHKQLEAENRRIIKAISVLGQTAKPRDILRLLQDNGRARYLTSCRLHSRLFQLKKAGRISLQNGKRNAEEMKEWRASIAAIVNGQDRQLGVRGVFYLALAARLCAKTETMYEAVVEALDRLRMSGRVAFERIRDDTRQIHPHGLERSPVDDLVTNETDYEEIRSHIDSTVEEEVETEPWIIAPTVPRYVQALEPDDLCEKLRESPEVWAEIAHGPWDGCEEVPFVLCEKAGLAGIIEPICEQYGVPFVATRGGASITILHELWELLQEGDLPWRLLTFYDYDKSGKDIERAALRRLEQFGGAAEWTSERIAVTSEQITRLKLPMRPEKSGYGEAVELDAIEPETLASIVTEAIKACIPEDIEERRLDAHMAANKTHRLRVEAMVEEFTEDYEPQRDEDMELYVEEAQEQFEDLIDEFLRDAPS